MDLRKTGLLLFLAAALLLAAPHILALTQLLYTYLAFPLKHTHVLGDADGFALHNLSHQAALLAAPSAAPYTTPLVPKIIHQVQLGNITMRPAWAAARAECARHHPAWDLRTWDDAAADAFVAAHYPHLFATYRGYPYEIQRTNILRYLLLHHYGGVYMDLDLKCLQPLDGLLGVPFLTPPANPTGVNNAFIVAAPGHAFLGFVVARVKKFDLRWGMPYVTNMFSTGCQFWSTMHILYPHREELAVLPQEYKVPQRPRRHPALRAPRRLLVAQIRRAPHPPRRHAHRVRQVLAPRPV
ncbi:glycosyltransferase family 32 protein, partial [Neolentinus lepideus HHB14362 ss-1]